eukprot:Sro20_g014420.2  (292) ;mRNA; r:164208-165083
MKHSSIRNGQVKVYFVIGNQRHPSQGDSTKAGRNITELHAEMEHYNDIVLLNSTDVHNFGKSNAWYIWAANDMPAEYHIKLDDESYVVMDNLLEALSSTPKQKFLGGAGIRMDRDFPPISNETIKGIPWLRGWGYIMSHDLIQGLVNNCSGLPWNTGGEHEDVYNAIAIQHCGMNDDRLSYLADMKVKSLRSTLSYGCHKEDVLEAIIIHGGMDHGNPFRRIAATTFATLHSIYHPLPGDLTSAWIKWERLRKLYLQDLKACDHKHADWSCNRHWKLASCLHEDETLTQAA